MRKILWMCSSIAPRFLHVCDLRKCHAMACFVYLVDGRVHWLTVGGTVKLDELINKLSGCGPTWSSGEEPGMFVAEGLLWASDTLWDEDGICATTMGIEHICFMILSSACGKTIKSMCLA